MLSSLHALEVGPETHARKLQQNDSRTADERDGAPCAFNSRIEDVVVRSSGSFYKSVA